jgi:hypothetical protein
MINHTGIDVSGMSQPSKFHDAALGALGLQRAMQLFETDGSDEIGYGVDYPVFWIDRFHAYGQKIHTAFATRSRKEVDAFHAAGIRAGGVDNGVPVLRDTSTRHPPGYDAALVLDPNGNNVEAVFREP